MEKNTKGGKRKKEKRIKDKEESKNGVRRKIEKERKKKN